MRSTLLLLIMIALFAGMTAGRAADAAARQDGLVARLETNKTAARVTWRFEKSLPAPLKKVAATFNGRSLNVAASASYPQGGDRTALMLLIDMTGGEARSQAVYRAMARLLRTYESIRPHQILALGVIEETVKLAFVDQGLPDPLGAMLENGVSDAAPELGTALEFATKALADQQAARRAAFIFTDGFSQTRINAQAIIDAAKKGGVSLNLLVDRSDRPADLESLKRIAAETGGLYEEGDAIRSVVEAPFSFVDSGAYADIALGDLFYYPWDDSRDLKVTFAYGDKSVDLTAPVEARPATATESLNYLWQNFGREAAVITAAAGWAIALVGMAVGGGYRRRARLARKAGRDGEAQEDPDADEHGIVDIYRRPDDASVASQLNATDISPAEEVSSDDTAGDDSQSGVDAIPESIATPPPRLVLRLFRPDGVTYVDVPLDGEQIRIGRGVDNDVVLKEQTVSTRQALLVADEQGGYTLQNLSETNPTRLNGDPVVHHELAGGEQVDLGGVRGEFIVVADADGGDAPFAAKLPLG